MRQEHLLRSLCLEGYKKTYKQTLKTKLWGEGGVGFVRRTKADIHSCTKPNEKYWEHCYSDLDPRPKQYGGGLQEKHKQAKTKLYLKTASHVELLNKNGIKTGAM